MKTHWIVIPLVIAGCFQVRHAIVKPPRIHPYAEEIVVTSMENIQLQCEGTRDINWTFPIAENKRNLARVSQNYSRNFGSEYSFVSHLDVRNATPRDTGYYYCRHRTEDQEAKNVADKIYVYVNDTKNLLVPFGAYGVTGQVLNKSAVIPCKPSSPDVNVTLYRGKEMEPCKDDRVTYDPKRGFRFSPLWSEASGEYVCWGNRRLARQNMTFHLIIFRELNKNDKPKISVESISHVIRGMRAKFECTIQVEIQTLFDMYWKIPNPLGLLTGRVIMGKAMKTRDFSDNVGFIRGTVVLTIENVTLDDEGYYECVVEDPSNNINSDKQLVKVHEPDAKYMYFTVLGNKQKVVNAGDPNVQWDVNVEAFPLPEIIWLNPMGQQISKTSAKYEIRKGRYSTMLKIIDITVSDAGTYQVKGISEDKVETENLTLIVRGDPYVVMEDSVSKVFNMHGENHTIKCNIVGFPSPNITWYFRSCGHKYPVCEENETALEEVFSEEYLSEDSLRKSSILKLDPLDNGYLTCLACNEFGCKNETISFFQTVKTGISTGLMIGLALGATIFCLIILCLLISNRKEQKLRRKLMQIGLANFEEGDLGRINPDLGVDDQAELLPYDKKWEFPREKLKLGKQLGSGTFGVVMKAEAYGIMEGEALTTVAVKMVKQNSEDIQIKALASELKIMVHLGKHLNVVNLLGASTKNLTKRELLVIVEYCHFGNLQSYLLRHRSNFIDQIDPSTGKIDPERVKRMERHAFSAASFHKGRGSGKAVSGMKYVEMRTSSCARSQRSQTKDYRVSSDTSCQIVDEIILNTDMSYERLLSSDRSTNEPERRTISSGDNRRRGDRSICTSDLICWAFQVARGIDYLASRKVLHGDLAARNILLAEDNVVKICDFGLAKRMINSGNYKKEGDGPLPIKWMAIESLKDRIFSTQSDIWSFGIVLWEFFSLAQTPYPGMEADKTFYNKLLAGYRMEKPPYATDLIYATMCHCWNTNPNERPSFTELTAILGEMLEETVKRHYIELNRTYMSLNDQLESTDYLGMMMEPSYRSAVRKSINHVEYVNAPSKSNCSVKDYTVMRSPVPTCNDKGDNKKDYLCMHSGSMRSTPFINQPRKIPPKALTHHGPSYLNQLKLFPSVQPAETKVALE